MGFITWVTTYALIILAELGDKTQLATLILASNNPGRRWVVFAGAATALSLCVLVEVTVGATLATFLTQEVINQIAGATFLIIGVITLGRHYLRSRGWQVTPGTGSELQK
ncbi:MAG TPA: TMEM165/GDT1 family protein [Bacillota bacterium]|nr:TMEM165/GDT1 family protein [Bacillota bacterium]